MSAKKIIGVIFLVLSVGFFVNGVVSVSRGIGLFDPSGLGVATYVGTFLPFLVALMIALA